MEYIEIYEDKEYWQKEMAAYLEEHSFVGPSIVQTSNLRPGLLENSNSQGGAAHQGARAKNRGAA